MSERFIVGLVVKNRFGVLSRISGLMSKRAFNIDSIASGASEHAKYTRVTIVARGDDYVKDQVVKQLRKLVDVKEVYLFEDEEISIEHALVKIKVNEDNKQVINQLISDYSGKIMDFSCYHVTTEVSGDTAKVERFIEKAADFGVVEMCRSGVITLARGAENSLCER